MAAYAALAGMVGTTPAAPAPFDSTADTVFDIIRASDPSTYLCLEDRGRGIRQMWDKRVDAEFDLDAYLFRAYFSDAPPVDIIVNPEFGSQGSARTEALRYPKALGRLPFLVRSGLTQIGIHKGRPTYSAGPGKMFVYAQRTDIRLAQNRLEESLFHESVHASLDRTYARAPIWQDAQAADDAFLTDYAADHPDSEDLAETMLFAYAVLVHPGRIPPVDTDVIARTVPARIAVIKDILDAAPRSGAAPSPPETCQ